MVGEQDETLGRIAPSGHPGDLLLSEHAILTRVVSQRGGAEDDVAQRRQLPGRIETEYLPVRVLNQEEAGWTAMPIAVPAKHDILAEQRVEIAFAARIHVVIAVNAPRADGIALLPFHGPKRQHVLPVFIRFANVIDVAQVNDMRLA